MTQEEQISRWMESVNANLAALITIVTSMAGMGEKDYKALVVQCQARSDQVCAAIRDQQV